MIINTPIYISTAYPLKDNQIEFFKFYFLYDPHTEEAQTHRTYTRVQYDQVVNRNLLKSVLICNANSYNHKIEQNHIIEQHTTIIPLPGGLQQIHDLLKEYTLDNDLPSGWDCTEQRERNLIEELLQP
jgi:hypothetical protein